MEFAACVQCMDLELKSCTNAKNPNFSGRYTPRPPPLSFCTSPRHIFSPKICTRYRYNPNPPPTAAVGLTTQRPYLIRECSVITLGKQAPSPCSRWVIQHSRCMMQIALQGTPPCTMYRYAYATACTKINCVYMYIASSIVAIHDTQCHVYRHTCTHRTTDISIQL